MEEKKVTIVGAGIGGLSCAWQLIKKGWQVLILEKEAFAGGRTLYSGAITPGDFDIRLNRLIKEFELEELKVPLRRENIGFFTEKGEMIDLPQLYNQLKKMFSFREGIKLWQTFRWINKLNFDLENPKDLLPLRKISFEQFLANYPPKIAQVLRETACFFGETEKWNPRVISAEEGLCVVRLANELQSGRAFTFEENNILTLSNVLVKKIEEMGGKIFLSSEVKKIEKEGGRFRIYWEKAGEKREIDSPLVVINTTLDITKKIFPQLNLQTDIYYIPLKTYLVRGEFKYPSLKVIKGNLGNPARLVIGYNTIPYYQTFHCPEDQEIDFSFFYKTYEILEEKIVYAIPVVGPQAKVPSLKTEIEGAYLVGDFYYHPFLEAAIATGEMVAKMIAEKT